MRERRRLSIPSLVGIRASFTGKMAVSGSLNKDKLSSRDILVPPCDAEDPEKNWDSVSTLGYQCAELLGATRDDRSKAAGPSGRLEAANQFLEKPPNSLLNDLMAEDEANSPPSHAGKASKRPSVIMRRISEACSEGMEEEDKMEAMRLEIIDLKAKLEEKEEKMVTMEVELEVALESLREAEAKAKEKMAADEAAADQVDRRGSEEASRSSYDKSTSSAYDLYALKSRIKELEMENKRLRKQLPSSNGGKIEPENIARDQPKEAAKSSNRRRRSRVSFKSISSVPSRVNFRTKSSKSLNARQVGKKNERRRVTMNHITSPAPPSSSDGIDRDEGRRVTMNHVKSPAQPDASTAKRNATRAGSKRRVTIK